MFISKRRYANIKFRLAEMEKAIEEHDGYFFAMSESIAGVQDRIGTLEEEAEYVSQERKREKDFYDGFSNIMNYEVSYGKKEPSDG